MSCGPPLANNNFAAFPAREELLLDAPEPPVPHPEDKHNRKRVVSGKQHAPPVKPQIVAPKTPLLPVCGGLPGSVDALTV